jgi:uncharacterized coiled-coil protein SlyX
VGDSALARNTVGYSNTATGVNALVSNTTGFANTANGIAALFSNTTGTYNTALGVGAGQSLTAGDNNVCIGAFVTGVAGESNTTRIRNVYDSVANIRSVYVNLDNKIGTLSSSRRYKDEIKPMAKASEAILSLRPVSFRYKKEVDRTRSLSFGLIAEEVAQISPDLITRDAEGQPQTVRYEAINAMLLNEFLKEHRTVQEQKTTIAQLKNGFAEQQKEMDRLITHVKEQDSKIQEVNEQLQLRKPMPQMTNNN